MVPTTRPFSIYEEDGARGDTSSERAAVLVNEPDKPLPTEPGSAAPNRTWRGPDAMQTCDRKPLTTELAGQALLGALPPGRNRPCRLY